MAFENNCSRTESVRDEGHMLVRRFTDELSGQTTLERATITAQQEEDERIERKHEARMRALYEDQSREPSDVDFHDAETARLALQKTCQMLETSSKQSNSIRLGFHRKNVQATTAAVAVANETGQQIVLQDFFELRSVINGLETKWKANQGKVSRQFRRLCGTLDAHQKAFAIFPSQNNYTSALCGSLSLIVRAAVNHDDIADTLSEAVANIAVKATRVAKILHVIKTQVMRELFSELYAHVFLFYRDAIEWYTKSKTSRFFGSFNEKVVERYEKAAAQIENCITEMYREANIAGLAMLAVVNSTASELRDEAVRARQQAPFEVSLAFAGRNMQQMLMAMHQSVCNSAPIADRERDDRLLTMDLESSSVGPDSVDRAEARKHYAPLLEQFIVGDEGHSLFQDGKFWLPDVDVSSKLRDWMGDEARTPTLWISSPAVSQGVSTSRAAALTTLVAAWKSEMPLISHFCQRVRFTDVPEDRTVEEVSMLGLVYSLITQLLQFEFDDDEFETSMEQLNRLDGSDASWPTALTIFSELLKTTPHLSVCVIDGLNDLSFSTGADWCGEFLKVLFTHQRACNDTFRILITTAGQSRVIPEYIGAEDRVFAQSGVRQVIHGGQWVTAPER